MSMRKVQRFTEQDIQRVVARGNGSTVLAQQAIGPTPRVSGEAAGSSAAAASGGNEAPVRGKQVMLPWPPSILSPNARPHWSAKSKAAKQYRNICYLIAHESGLRGVELDGAIHLWITYLPPDRRQRDDDNLIAAFKSGRDGLADALGVDDKRFRIHPWLSDEVVKGGAVKVRISMGPQE